MANDFNVQSDDEHHSAYWSENVRLLTVLLAIWATAGFLLPIILVDVLDSIPFFGFKLGFWFAQQGSIYVFVILIFVYAFLMHRIDRKYGVDDD
ncbi:MAG: DUF4212 domain-containing protein [Alphaproteobacteria bacterium]